MDIYVAELDETGKIAAVWVKQDSAFGPGVFDPQKHKFDPKSPHQFAGACRAEIERWMVSKTQETTHTL